MLVSYLLEGFRATVNPPAYTPEHASSLVHGLPTPQFSYVTAEIQIVSQIVYMYVATFLVS